MSLPSINPSNLTAAPTNTFVSGTQPVIPQTENISSVAQKNLQQQTETKLEKEQKVDYDTPIDSKDSNENARWVKTLFLSKHQPYLPPILTMKELDASIKNEELRGFLKKWSEFAIKAQKPLDAIHHKADPQNRYIFIPEKEGCRIIKTSNKHKDKEKLRGGCKVFSLAESVAFNGGVVSYASLGAVINPCTQDDLVQEVINCKLVALKDYFVQTVYILKYTSNKKDKAGNKKKKIRFIQLRADHDLDRLNYAEIDATAKKQISDQIILCVRALADEELIHRDLKPTNILITKISNSHTLKYQVQLCDLAPIMKMGEPVRSISTTADYLAPEVATLRREYSLRTRLEYELVAKSEDPSVPPLEQEAAYEQFLKGQKALDLVAEKLCKVQTDKMDVWSLGCTLFNVWTNCNEFLPWSILSDDVMPGQETEVIYQNLSNDAFEYIPYITEMLTKYQTPPEMINIIIACLTRDPKKRPSIYHIKY